MKWRITALVLLLAGLFFLAQQPRAQLAMTGVGGGFGAGGGGGAYVGPGDIVSGAKMWWGFRAYNAAYAAAGGNGAQICLAAMTSCTVMVFGSNGNLIVTTVGGMSCSSVTCYVYALYDQSGASSCSGGSCTLNVDSFSPPVFILNCQNSQPCMRLGDNATQGFNSSNVAISTISGFSLTNYINLFATQANYTPELTCMAGLYTQTGPNGTALYTQGGASQILVNLSSPGFHALVGVATGTSSSNLMVDGTSNTGTVSMNTDCMGNPVEVGVSGGTAPGTIYWNEGGLWTTLFNTTQMNNMNTNMTGYW